MRLWSLHPKYLDRMGLLAVWREGLLAQSVFLKGEFSKCNICKGIKCNDLNLSYKLTECRRCHDNEKIKTPYWNHPQLNRFKGQYSKQYIGWYLLEVYEEGYKRNYKFDEKRIVEFDYTGLDYLTVPKTQLEYEFKHLQHKLLIRDTKQRQFNAWYVSSIGMESHPLFKIIDGNIEPWEKIKND